MIFGKGDREIIFGKGDRVFAIDDVTEYHVTCPGNLGLARGTHTLSNPESLQRLEFFDVKSEIGRLWYQSIDLVELYLYHLFLLF
uniref:Uncharacterized protein n=1 Tax=Romanomermis culicivorax TaxID=13658 RepID=A0A915HYU8_ROMCU